MELNKIKDLVIKLLKEKEILRGSDDLLYLEVLKLNRADVEKMTVWEFFKYRKNWELPSFETVSRCRRKAQEEHPELRPNIVIQEMRKKEEKKFYDFSKLKQQAFDF